MAQNADLFNLYFQRADLDRDGRISGAEAVSFFQASGLPKLVLAKIWDYADQNRTGFLDRAEFYNALRLVTVVQSKRELTPELVKAALYGPAAAKIPAPQMNLPGMPASQLNATQARPIFQTGLGNSVSSQNFGSGRPQHCPIVSSNQQQYMPQANQIMSTSQSVSASSSALTQAATPQGFPAVSASPQGFPAVSASPIGFPAVDASPQGFSAVSASPQGFPAVAASPQGFPAVAASPQGFPAVAASPQGFPAVATSPQGFPAVAASVSARPPAPSISGSPASLPPRPHVPPSTAPSTPPANDTQKVNVSSNGFTSDSIFGVVFASTQAHPRQESSAINASAVSSAILSSSSAAQTSARPNMPSPLQSPEALPPLASHTQATQSAGKLNQQVSHPTTSGVSFSTVSPVEGKSPPSKPQSPWPKMTRSDVQKYMKVFLEVDKDKDGKITGGEARNLFLSWRLPREILKQVWDLSDQDNDSMLSLREFCIALYLMERHREGRTLPSVLPSNLILDLPPASQPTMGYGNVAWAQLPGLQQHRGSVPSTSPQVTHVARGRPPRPPTGPLAEEVEQPAQQKVKIPVLEKHLVDQLSSEEQKSLNSKLQEATDADKMVRELEKEISDSKQKIEFYRVKMQELVLYKSRCDSRLNEIMERASGDKREVDTLSKRYEGKCRQVGDVASKLTIEEATFRDIQEKKMELYRSILSMEKNGKADGALQIHVDHIQEDLDELVKVLNDRCKKYGLRAKPTSLLELPFGWQPGLQETAADWDEEWDNFQEEGFTFVKEFTLNVQNVIAPPKEKSSSRVEATAAVEVQTDPSPFAEESRQNPSPSNVDAPVIENGVDHNESENGTPRSAPRSPAADAPSSAGSPKDSTDPTFGKNSFESSAVFDRDNLSDHETAGSVHSGDRTFDDPAWGTSENDDLDSVWGFNAIASPSPWEIDHDRLRDDNFLSGSKTDFGLNPIRTGSQHGANSPRRSTFFDESVPSTPLYTPGPQTGSHERSIFFDESVPSSPLYTSGMQPQRSSVFFDESVPSTPLYSSAFSPTHREQSGPPFDISSQFDSFNSRDGGGFFSQPDTLTRFNSIRSSRDFDQGHGFPSFDDSDPFGTGPFRTSRETPRSSDHWNAFS